MSRILHPGPLRLSEEDYNAVCRYVLNRDDWRCQACGQREQLEVHHLQHRSQGGSDAADNLIVLCGPCHRAAHRGHA